MQGNSDFNILPSVDLHVTNKNPECLKESTIAPVQNGDRILVLLLSGIGDALMFTPSLDIIKQAYPDIHIDILTMFKGIADIFSSNPNITMVHHWDFLKESPLRTIHFLRSLGKNYSHTITAFPANRWHYAVVARAIGSRFRIGHTYLHDSLSQLNMLNNVRIKENDALHNCEENLRIASLLGCSIPHTIPGMSIHLTKDDLSFSDQWMMHHNLHEKSVLGIHAGSAIVKNQINKRWSPEYYAQVCAEAHAQLGLTTLLFGGPEELGLNQSIVEMIQEKQPDANPIIVETPTLTKSIALMKQCRAFISNDSGLMHCAAALQLPMIAIFGYTSHVHTAPWMNPKAKVARRDLACSPCFYFSPKPASCKYQGTDKEFTCIRDIQPDDIFRSLKHLIEHYKV